MKTLSQQKLNRMSAGKRQAYEKKLKRVKRNRRIAITLVLTVFTFIIVGVLCVTVLFKVNNIKVTGDETYSSQEVINASGIKKGSLLVKVDNKTVASVIKKELPYIGSVKVSKKIPSTIVLSIEKSSADVYIKTSSGYAVCNSSGKVLSISPQIPDKDKLIPLKVSPKTVIKEGEIIDYKTTAKALSTVIDAIDAQKMKDITQINLSVPSDIYITYQKRFKLHIGNYSSLEEKLSVAKTIIAKEDKSTPNEKGEINLTVEKKAYVTQTK